MALEMRTACERCVGARLRRRGGDLLAECTFCASCGDELGHVCPNCGGELVARHGGGGA